MKKSLLLLSAFSMLSNIAAAAGSVSLKEVPALIISTYVFAIIFLVVFLLLAIVISNMISFEGGANPKDAGKRRRWFWIFAIVGPISVFLYNFLVILPSVRKGPAFDKFSMHVPIASIVILVSYILVGFIIAKMQKSGKLGNWFPSKN